MHISVLSRLEILVRMWPHEEERTLQLLSSLPSLDQAIADAAGHSIFSQMRQGIALNVPDAIIAATALHYELTLVSYGMRHIRQIPGLKMHDITER